MGPGRLGLSRRHKYGEFFKRRKNSYLIQNGTSFPQLRFSGSLQVWGLFPKPPLSSWPGACLGASSSCGIDFQLDGPSKRQCTQRSLDHPPRLIVGLLHLIYVPMTGNSCYSGSKQIWGSFLKDFHADMPNRAIYALDLRNHGSSPHAAPMTYEAMAEDVNKFVEDRNLTNVTLLGHSMSVIVHLTLVCYTSDVII